MLAIILGVILGKLFFALSGISCELDLVFPLENQFISVSLRYISYKNILVPDVSTARRKK